MGADQHIDWHAAAISALDWWREAGVDTLVDEAPRDWSAKVGRPVAAPGPSSNPIPLVAAPDDLAAFVAWRSGQHVPEAAWRGPVFAPFGDPASDLMVLVAPEREDVAEGHLLAGPAGRLFDRMLAAIGRDRGSVYAAPVCIRRCPGRPSAAEEQQLAELAKAHVRLAAPRRLLLLGNLASHLVLGIECLRARGGLRALNQDGGKPAVEAVASFHPRFLIERPAMKAEAWKDLQRLIGGIDQ